MSQLIYCSEANYVISAATRAARIARIEAIIDALLVLQTTVSGDQNIMRYKLNDGQTEIEMQYRNSTDIAKSIDAWQKTKHTMMNEGSRIFRRFDWKNMR